MTHLHDELDTLQFFAIFSLAALLYVKNLYNTFHYTRGTLPRPEADIQSNRERHELEIEYTSQLDNPVQNRKQTNVQFTDPQIIDNSNETSLDQSAYVKEPLECHQFLKYLNRIEKVSDLHLVIIVNRDLNYGIKKYSALATFTQNNAVTRMKMTKDESLLNTLKEWTDIGSPTQNCNHREY